MDKAAIHKEAKMWKHLGSRHQVSTRLLERYRRKSTESRYREMVNTNADIYILMNQRVELILARRQVYNVINDLVKEEMCCIVSSELPEIIGISDRVIVMRHGRIMADIDRQSSHFNQEDIMKAAWGGKIQ